jgi:hypothetical protein
MRVMTRQALGQLRINAEIPNQFSSKSDRALPFPSVDELLAEKKIRGLEPTDSVRPFPGSIQPPSIPQVKNQRIKNKRAQNMILWPRAEAFDIPIDEILFDQPLPPKTPMRRINEINRAQDAAGGNLLTPTRREASAFAPMGPSVYGREDILAPRLSSLGQGPDAQKTKEFPVVASIATLGGLVVGFMGLRRKDAMLSVVGGALAGMGAFAILKRV